MIKAVSIYKEKQDSDPIRNTGKKIHLLDVY